MGSFVPSIILACIFPLHALWFRGCINGFIRRARTPPVVSIEVSHPSIPAGLDKGHAPSNSPRLSSALHEGVYSQSPTVPPSRQLPHPRGRLFRKAIRIQVDLTMKRLVQARRGLYGSLPRRDVIFEFFGLSSATTTTT